MKPVVVEQHMLAVLVVVLAYHLRNQFEATICFVIRVKFVITIIMVNKRAMHLIK